MQVVYPHCAGLDVHKETVVACVLHRPDHGPARCAVRTFPTLTGDLEKLGDWLVQEGVTIAAMESTGVFWKPVWNLLESRLALMLVNAHHIKQVPGRKTDVKDSRWLADLLQHGLLKPSFVPDAALRELRDLTRGRAALTADRTRVVNRVQKILEDANIKLASVASNVVGVSGLAMLHALIEGTKSPADMADLARSSLRGKKPELEAALTGKVTDHHRFLLSMLLQQIDAFDKQIAAYEARMDVVMGPFVRQAVEQIDPIPGINRQAAIALIAEIGPDMARFPSADHLCSWAGMCPGNNQSGGKRKPGKLKPGNRWLKALLDQIAWAASKKKGSFFQARYRRLAARRGKKRAAMATGRSVLVAVYAVLANHTDFHDLGHEFFLKRQSDRAKHHLVHRLEQLGFQVTLQPAA
jgi:transposase